MNYDDDDKAPCEGPLLSFFPSFLLSFFQGTLRRACSPAMGFTASRRV
jgi:hypothetical protein